jgi:predicted nucleic acid-binding protein
MNKITAQSKLYIDTNIFIYFIERVDPFYQPIKQIFAHISDVGATIYTSEITIAECLHKPYRSGDRQLIGIYELLFERSNDVKLIELSGPLAKRAAEIGAPLGLRLIDSIHYVSALAQGCTFFISSDAKFKSTAELEVMIPPIPPK